MPIYNTKKVINATGIRGTLILSNQNAIHRGLPQTNDRKRVTLVFAYLVLSKLSYLTKMTKENLKNSKKYLNNNNKN